MTKAALMALAGINGTGGVMHFDDDTVEFIPMHNIRSIKITAPSVVIGSALDIPQRPAGGVTL